MPAVLFDLFQLYIEWNFIQKKRKLKETQEKIKRKENKKIRKTTTNSQRPNRDRYFFTLYQLKHKKLLVKSRNLQTTKKRKTSSTKFLSTPKQNLTPTWKIMKKYTYIFTFELISYYIFLVVARLGFLLECYMMSRCQKQSKWKKNIIYRMLCRLQVHNNKKINIHTNLYKNCGYIKWKRQIDRQMDGRTNRLIDLLNTSIHKYI